MHIILLRRRLSLKLKCILFFCLIVVTVFSVDLLRKGAVDADSIIPNQQDDALFIFPNLQSVTNRLLTLEQVNNKADDDEISTLMISRSRDYYTYNLKAKSTATSIMSIAPLSGFKNLWKRSRTDQKELNRTLRTLDLWNGDISCLKHQVHLLKKGSVPFPSALVSFPGSGNSWLRMLLMGITGVYVDSVYEDDSIFHSKANHSYEIPVDCGCTLLQKTHDFSLYGGLMNVSVTNKTRVLEKYKYRGLLVIRNPFTAIRSYRNFAFGGLQGTAPESFFQETSDWDDFVSQGTLAWETLASVWIRGLKEGCIVYYEKLKRDTKEELSRIAKILDIELDKDRLDCVIQHTKDNSFVRQKDNITRDIYSTEQKMLLHKAIESVQQVLKERGLDPLPVKYYEHYDALPEYAMMMMEASLRRTL